MLDLLSKLIEAINKLATSLVQLATTNWTGSVSAICSVISLITIIILLIERCEKKRPYLQISFELVKSSLVCLVIRNVGETPAQLKELKFNSDFVKQLPPNAQKSATDRSNLNISIHPKQQWVLCLDVITPNVLQYQNTQLEVSFTYTAKGKRNRKYKDTEIINFNDYSGFLVYISEVDELRDGVKKLTQAMNAIAKPLNKLADRHSSPVQSEIYRNMNEVCSKSIITGTQENVILKSSENNTQPHDDVPSEVE